jgi:hypothetical protein
MLVCGAFLLQSCQKNSSYVAREQGDEITIQTDHYTLQVQKKGFRFQFIQPDGNVIAPSHAVSGLQLGKTGEILSDITSTQLLKKGADFLEFAVGTDNGLEATVIIRTLPHRIKLEIKPVAPGEYSIIARTGGLAPAYGMADHAARGEGGQDLELKNFVREPLEDDHGGTRMISNFVVFPKQGFATVNMEPDKKIVRITETENAQGSQEVRSIPALYYFIGSPKEIYQAYLTARNEEGYPVYKPKHEWFGVGWEAFGALAWRTSHETVTENINHYLEDGYPLNWMVVGSGFWPSGPGEFDEHGTPYSTESASEAAKKLQATTSFGMWDKARYPDPKGFIDYFHSRGIIFTIGLRLGFIPGGPFTDEGLKNGYFIPDESGQARLFQIGFPRVPIHFLDTRNPEAVKWYVQLCGKWLAYGVDGFKEDLFGWPDDVQDDLIDPINRLLMDQGVFIMGRNNYLGSPADIHRFDDFNYNQSQDRGPINGLAYAFSGFPNVYPDIVGGTGLATGRFGDEPKDKLRTYIVRYAQYASLNPSMAFGYGPWNFDEATNRRCLEAAQLHHRLKPHIFSNAIRAYQTGFPYPLTPLPLAFPNDPKVYGLATTEQRSYEWLIGESLLAAPLYGDDYPSAFSRDIYLPEGKWMDYQTGTLYDGSQTLEDFDIPIDKTPLFIGGTGFVVEQENGQLLGRIYPLNPKSETTFFYQDGETESNISIDVESWDKLSVAETSSDQKIDLAFIRYAYQFVLEPGKNYKIR